MGQISGEALPSLRCLQKKAKYHAESEGLEAHILADVPGTLLKDRHMVAHVGPRHDAWAPREPRHNISHDIAVEVWRHLRRLAWYRSAVP